MSGSSGFALWITGMPASGKSSVARELVQQLKERKAPVVILESDRMRTILTPNATYGEEERDRFYETLVLFGDLIVKSGVNVIFDATANRRAYRQRARALIPRFVEVYIQCPLDVCMGRDPKGIYRSAQKGEKTTVPGLQSPYEPPVNAEVLLDCRNPPEAGVALILDKLKQLLYI